MKPDDLVNRLLESDDPAYDVYQKALEEHPEWWEAYRQGEVEADSFADGIFDKILDVYDIEPGSPLADEIYEHIYAGLT